MKRKGRKPDTSARPGNGSLSVQLAGVHAVMTALKTRPDAITRVLLEQPSQNRRLNELESLARQAGIRVNKAARSELDQVSEIERHQGVLAEMTASAEWSEADLAKLLDQLDTDPLLLVLDGVTDPHNLGACLRTAEASGVQAVIVPRDRASGLTAVVRKSSAGAAELVPLVQVTNLARTLRALKDRGIWLVATSDQAEVSLYDQNLKGPLALVMGSEGQGIRRLTAELCDYLVSIPMAGAIESLNVSVATGVCLYEILRQRDHQQV